MRILITGGNGFLGKNLVSFLQKETNYELVTIGRKELDLLNPLPVLYDNKKLFTGSSAISIFLAENRIDAVIHLAGNVGGIGYNKDNQGRLGFENLQMGLNVLEASRLTSVKKLVMIGTTCSYPNTPKTIPFIEDELFDGMPEITNSGYGIAKRTLVKLGIEYSKQYGMNITNLIPGNMYGPHDHFEDDKSHVIPAMIKKFENPEPVGGVHSRCVSLWGSGKASREFLYVEDCCRAIEIALQRDTGPEPINLGTNTEITISQLADKIKTIGSYDATILFDNRNPDGQPRRSLDITRAKNILRWEPRVSLDEGLKTTIDWYRNHV